MTNVTYTGESDFQVFSSADFKKAKVEDQNKVTFAKGVPQEVSEAAAKALTSEDGVFGRHSFELSDEDETTDEATDDPNTDSGEGDDELDLDAEPAPATSGKAAKTEGTVETTTTVGEGKSTGRGSSTRTR